MNQISDKCLGTVFAGGNFKEGHTFEVLLPPNDTSDQITEFMLG